MALMMEEDPAGLDGKSKEREFSIRANRLRCDLDFLSSFADGKLE